MFIIWTVNVQDTQCFQTSTMSTVVNCFVFITDTQGTCKFQFEKSRQIPLELWARGRDSIHFHGKIEGNCESTTKKNSYFGWVNDEMNGRYDWAGGTA